MTPLQQALDAFKRAVEQAEAELDPREFATLVSVVTVWAAAQNARYLDDEAAA